MSRSPDPFLSIVVSAGRCTNVLAKWKGVPLAVANRVFGKDALKQIIKELNEVVVA
jgi:hypothetical protein